MNGFPVTAGWGALILGAIAHERGDLAEASRHVGTVIADADRVHFICLREAFFVQILAYEAQGLRAEADRAIARLRELAIASETAHQLELVDSFLARTALIRGDLAAAQRWLEASSPSPCVRRLQGDRAAHADARSRSSSPWGRTPRSPKRSAS